MKRFFAILTCAALLCCAGVAYAEAGREFYGEAVQRLIFPYVWDAAVREHWAEVGIDWYDLELLDVSRASDGGLRLTVEFRPYLGAHISISRDRAVVETGFSGARVREYAILERYEVNAPWLPPYR